MLCAAVGVAFIILMPIIGLILCSCRCAGHCGGKRRHDDFAKDNRCRTATCGLLLLVLATLIMYVCYFCLLIYLSVHGTVVFLPRDALECKRGLAIACRLSICPSVCDVGGS